MLDQGSQALFTTSLPLPRSSFELWHSRLGHVNFDVIKQLHKLSYLNVSSILSMSICWPTCQMSKRKRLLLHDNIKRYYVVPDLVHCVLWEPSPVASFAGFS